jgi:hypothetical protein
VNAGRNYLDVMLAALHCMAKKFGVEIFGELQNVVLEENREDKMVRESN